MRDPCQLSQSEQPDAQSGFIRAAHNEELSLDAVGRKYVPTPLGLRSSVSLAHCGRLAATVRSSTHHVWATGEPAAIQGPIRS